MTFVPGNVTSFAMNVNILCNCQGFTWGCFDHTRPKWANVSNNMMASLAHIPALFTLLCGRFQIWCHCQVPGSHSQKVSYPNQEFPEASGTPLTYLCMTEQMYILTYDYPKLWIPDDRIITI